MALTGSTNRRSTSFSVVPAGIAGGTMLGLSATGSSSALWWGVGEFLLVASAVLIVCRILGTHVRGFPVLPWGRRTWTITACTIPLTSLAGALFFDGPASALAVAPVLTLACGVGAERAGARRRVVAAVWCGAGATALVALLRGGEAQAGFAALIQGSVVSGAFVALLVASRAAIRLWRR